MPNRIIKDSIRTSRTVNAMTDFQFRVWVYLITYVDDYGRGSADPELIKGFVFPRRKRVSESDIEKTLAELAGMGCISLYDVDGESYFYFPNWGEHQRIQTKKSKFPAPDCCNSRLLTVTHGGPPPESESESKSNTPPTPPGGRRAPSLPKYQPDWFDRFWSIYPRKTNRVQAVKAWDKLKPDLALCKVMAEAIRSQMKSQQWQDPQHIPHPSTWLNGRRWDDELPDEARETGQQAARRGRIALDVNGEEVAVFVPVPSP